MVPTSVNHFCLPLKSFTGLLFVSLLQNGFVAMPCFFWGRFNLEAPLQIHL